MKIAFPCPGCGKTLKSRNGEVGRTRKCPVCSTRVTCPEPVAEARFIHDDVLEAEIVEAERIPAAARAAPAARRGAAANGNGAGTRAARSAPAPRRSRPGRRTRSTISTTIRISSRAPTRSRRQPRRPRTRSPARCVAR